MELQTLIVIVVFILGFLSWAEYCVTHTRVIRNTWEYFFTPVQEIWENPEARFPLILLFLLVLAIAGVLIIFVPSLPPGLVGCLVGVAGVTTRFLQPNEVEPEPMTEARNRVRKCLLGGTLAVICLLIFVFGISNVHQPEVPQAAPVVVAAKPKSVDATGETLDSSPFVSAEPKAPVKIVVIKDVPDPNPGGKKAATMKVGDKVPAFQGIDDQGKAFKSSDVVGKKVVVLFLYPAALTGG